MQQAAMEQARHDDDDGWCWATSAGDDYRADDYCSSNFASRGRATARSSWGYVLRTKLKASHYAAPMQICVCWSDRAITLSSLMFTYLGRHVCVRALLLLLASFLPPRALLPPYCFFSLLYQPPWPSSHARSLHRPPLLHHHHAVAPLQRSRIARSPLCPVALARPLISPQRPQNKN